MPDTITPSDPSWWLSEALSAEGHIAPSAALGGAASADVLIVGGGFTGLWTALAIKRDAPQTSVILIDAGICGSGASGKNGGKVHGYWASLPGLAETLGPDAALAVAWAGTRAQDGIRRFVQATGNDVWWREAGNVRVSASTAQDAKITRYIETAERLGVPDSVRRLSADDVAQYCRSPAFRAGLYLPEGANVQPARLARALRQEALRLGVTIHENTRMLKLEPGAPNRVTTPSGEVTAKDVVLATNIGLASDPSIRKHVTVFSSYALMTEPASDELQSMGWKGDEGFADLRMFVHYFRKTVDGRVLMGAGSGPISFNGRSTPSYLTRDVATGNRAVHALRRLLPGLNETGVSKIWGGGIDVSSDRLPFFRTRLGTRVHEACGYSGHGVNPTYIGGQCLASLVLDRKDEWTSSPFCTRQLPTLPPEPFRTIGGRLVRRGIIRCEEAEDGDRNAALVDRIAAAIPKAFGLRIGTR